MFANLVGSIMMNLLMRRRRRSGSSDDWWQSEYPGAMLAIRFTTLANTGDTVTPYVAKSGVSVMWDYGDGSTQTANSGSHAYASDGPHDLTLVIYDEPTTITQLQMQSDQLSGSIPVEIGNLTALTYLNLSSNSFITADMDGFVNTVWSVRDNFTASPSINIGGTNADPSGVYQDMCSPTTPLEKIYNLANAQCAGDTFNAQTWVY
jgi:hypothetical protein